MPQQQVASYSAALTANGDVGGKGYVTVASTVGVYPGAKGWLSDAQAAPSTLNQRVVVTDVPSATLIGIRFIPDGTDDPKLQTRAVFQNFYGKNSCATFLTANTARLDLPQQLVEVVQPAFTGVPSV